MTKITNINQIVQDDRFFIIAMDGPSGVGKGTQSAFWSVVYNLQTFDTGAAYRGITSYMLRNKIALPLAVEIAQMLFDTNKIAEYWQGAQIRSQEVVDYVATVAKIPGVRAVVEMRQHDFAIDAYNARDTLALPNGNKIGGVLVEGRNIGTDIFPDAIIKIYMDANAETKAWRRFNELRAQGIPADYEEILASMTERDNIDKNRCVGKMCVPTGAFFLDTSGLTRGQVLDVAMNYINPILNAKKLERTQR